MSKKEEILHKLSTEDRNYIKKKFKEREEFCTGQVESLTNLINVLIEVNKELNNEKFDLEAKLAESEKSNEYFADRIEKADKEIKENYKNYNKLVEEYNQLKQQLAEKERKIEELKTTNDRLYNKNQKLTNTIVEDNIAYYKKGVIAELEEVKQLCDGIMLSEKYISNCDTKPFQSIIDYINQQIKSLKGEN